MAANEAGSDGLQRTVLRERALSRWDNEGGAVAPVSGDAFANMAEPTRSELIHLRVRVIALENLLIAVLADGPDRRLVLARDMATFISPREGFTQHPLTLQAASQMVDLVDRVEHFKTRDGPVELQTSSETFSI